MVLGGAWFPMALALAVIVTAGTVSNRQLVAPRFIANGAELQDVRFSNFTSRTLEATSFRGSNLLMSDFRMATLRKVDFTGANLTWVNFAGARICETVMPDGSSCDLDCSGPYGFQPGTASTCPYLALEH